VSIEVVIKSARDRCFTDLSPSAVIVALESEGYRLFWVLRDGVLRRTMFVRSMRYANETRGAEERSVWRAFNYLDFRVSPMT
jgi:hypothetical protein